MLPGVFALFGFQLFAAFNDIFDKQVTRPEKILYLVAQVLLAACIAMLLTPAAYHRTVRPHSVSDAFANLISALLKWAMRPLLLVFPIDAYLVAKVVTRSTTVSAVVGAFVLFLFVAAWIVFPRFNRARLVRERAAAERQGEDLAPA